MAALALDSGHTAWILISMALVQLMLPGLAFFYAGLLHRKSVRGAASNARRAPLARRAAPRCPRARSPRACRW